MPRAKSVEAGCGIWLFPMDGVDGCQLAVKVDSKPYLVSGANVDAHKAGLCDAPKTGEVLADVDGDRFVAKKFILKN